MVFNLAEPVFCIPEVWFQAVVDRMPVACFAGSQSLGNAVALRRVSRADEPTRLGL